MRRSRSSHSDGRGNRHRRLRRLHSLVPQDHAQGADQRLLPTDRLAGRRDLDPDSGLQELRPTAAAAGQHVSRRRGGNPTQHLLGGNRFGLRCGRDQLQRHGAIVWRSPRSGQSLLTPAQIFSYASKPVFGSRTAVFETKRRPFGTHFLQCRRYHGHEFLEGIDQLS